MSDMSTTSSWFKATLSWYSADHPGDETHRVEMSNTFSNLYLAKLFVETQIEAFRDRTDMTWAERDLTASIGTGDDRYLHASFSERWGDPITWEEVQ